MRRHQISPYRNDNVSLGDSSFEPWAFSLALANRFWDEGPVTPCAHKRPWKHRRVDEQFEYVAACMAAAREASKGACKAAYIARVESRGLKVRRTGSVDYGDGAGAIYAWLETSPTLEAMDDGELIRALELKVFYQGPGMPFTDSPWVRRRTKRGALVTQRYGWDT